MSTLPVFPLSVKQERRCPKFTRVRFEGFTSLRRFLTLPTDYPVATDFERLAQLNRIANCSRAARW